MEGFRSEFVQWNKAVQFAYFQPPVTFACNRLTQILTSFSSIVARRIPFCNGAVTFSTHGLPLGWLLFLGTLDYSAGHLKTTPHWALKFSLVWQLRSPFHFPSSGVSHSVLPRPLSNAHHLASFTHLSVQRPLKVHLFDRRPVPFFATWFTCSVFWQPW